VTYTQSDSSEVESSATTSPVHITSALNIPGTGWFLRKTAQNSCSVARTIRPRHDAGTVLPNTHG
jgi:hypothetical protein